MSSADIFLLVMSRTFTLKGTSNVLSADYYPPIDLKPESEYALGLIGFHTYNSIPNIDHNTNKFYYDNDKVVAIPVGSYEITDIEEYLQSILSKAAISLKPNNNTLKCEIKSKFVVNFKPDDSIGRMLGFSARVLQANAKHESDLPVKIIKVVTIRIECNITTSAYYNTSLSHTLYEFAPQVEPGYSINIVPQHIIFLPVLPRSIDNITLRLLDQNGDPVNFRGEEIVVRLELKKTS